jgi:hypothetical protein
VSVLTGEESRNSTQLWAVLCTPRRNFDSSASRSTQQLSSLYPIPSSVDLAWSVATTSTNTSALNTACRILPECHIASVDQYRASRSDFLTSDKYHTVAALFLLTPFQEQPIEGDHTAYLGIKAAAGAGTVLVLYYYCMKRDQGSSGILRNQRPSASRPHGTCSSPSAKLWYSSLVPKSNASSPRCHFPLRSSSLRMLGNLFPSTTLSDPKKIMVIAHCMAEKLRGSSQ